MYLAYLDSGSGSLLLQALIATFLGGLYWIKVKWAVLRARFSRPTGAPDDVNRD